ncbi:MAG: hypothetical protein CO124_01660, partial [Candidatus Huberarchaeum crystalense]
QNRLLKYEKEDGKAESFCNNGLGILGIYKTQIESIEEIKYKLDIIISPFLENKENTYNTSLFTQTIIKPKENLDLILIEYLEIYSDFGKVIERNRRSIKKTHTQLKYSLGIEKTKFESRKKDVNKSLVKSIEIISREAINTTYITVLDKEIDDQIKVIGEVIEDKAKIDEKIIRRLIIMAEIAGDVLKLLYIVKEETNKLGNQEGVTDSIEYWNDNKKSILGKYKELDNIWTEERDICLDELNKIDITLNTRCKKWKGYVESTKKEMGGVSGKLKENLSTFIKSLDEKKK